MTSCASVIIHEKNMPQIVLVSESHRELLYSLQEFYLPVRRSMSEKKMPFLYVTVVLGLVCYT